MFLPNFCSFRMVLVVFLLAEILAIVLTLAIDYSGMGFLSEFGIRSLLILWIALASSAVLCVIAKQLNQMNDIAAGLIAFLVIQLIAALVCWLVVEVLPDGKVLPQLIDQNAKAGFYLRSIGISSLVSVAFLRHLFVQYKWKQQIEAKAQVKLEALQARMRPHFLFNSLNTIASLTRVEPQLAEKLIEDLSELFRASMTIEQSNMVRIDEELHLTKRYLEIEMQRFDNRLKIIWELADVPLDGLIPPLTLQPVIENAVYHGIELNPVGGEILIRGLLQNRRISLMVRNTSPPPGARTRRKTHHSALDNLAARIDGCYLGKGEIFKSLSGNYYQLTLAFPYITE